MVRMCMGELFSPKSLLVRRIHISNVRSEYRDCGWLTLPEESELSIVFYHFAVHIQTLHKIIEMSWQIR